MIKCPQKRNPEWQIQGNCSRQLSSKSCKIMQNHNPAQTNTWQEAAPWCSWDRALRPFADCLIPHSCRSLQPKPLTACLRSFSQAISELLGKSVMLGDARGSHPYVSIAEKPLRIDPARVIPKTDGWLTVENFPVVHRQCSAWSNWFIWLFHGATTCNRYSDQIFSHISHLYFYYMYIHIIYMCNYIYTPTTRSTHPILFKEQIWVDHTSQIITGRAI